MTDRERQLIIRLELEGLNAEFALRVDHGPTSTVADLFTPDGSYGYADGRRSWGRDEIRAAYAKRDAGGARTARHLFTNLRFALDGPERASGTTILTLFAADGAPPHPAEVLAVCDFEDSYVRCDDGQWRYGSRTIRTLFASERSTNLPLGGGNAGPPA